MKAPVSKVARSIFSDRVHSKNFMRSLFNNERNDTDIKVSVGNKNYTVMRVSSREVYTKK